MQRRVDLNEYKREQAAPGLKVTSRAFGIGRKMPIAQKLHQLSGALRREPDDSARKERWVLPRETIAGVSDRLRQPPVEKSSLGGDWVGQVQATKWRPNNYMPRLELSP